MSWRVGTNRAQDNPRNMLDLELHTDGSAFLMCGHAGETLHEADTFILHEIVIVGLTLRTVLILGALYRAAGYYAPVDLGVAVTGLRGLEEVWSGAGRRGEIGNPPTLSFTEDYYWSDRFMAQDMMAAPHTVARRLTQPLTRAMTRVDYDPFPAGS